MPLRWSHHRCVRLELSGSDIKMVMKNEIVIVIIVIIVLIVIVVVIIVIICSNNNNDSNHNMVIVIVCNILCNTVVITMIIIMIIIVVVIWTYEHGISYSCLFTKSDPAIIMAYFGVHCFSFQGPWCCRQPTRALWPVHPARRRPVATWQRMWGFGTGA